jgi:translocation and assembly module TamB
LASVSWKSNDLQIQAEKVVLEWSASELLSGKLAVKQLHIAHLKIDSAESNEPLVLPKEIRLPLAVDLADLEIGDFKYGTTVALEKISGHLQSNGIQHQLTSLKLKTSGAALQGEASLIGTPPFKLSAVGEIIGTLEQQPLQLSFTVNGPLDRLLINAAAQQGISGLAEIELTPFAAALFTRADITLQQINPAAWQAGAPKGDLDLQARLSPQGDGLKGTFNVTNKTPGPLDKNALPISELSGQFVWQEAATKLDKLQAKLLGKGELNGSGEWKNSSLDLKLQAKQLDASQLATVLRWTRLNGQISAHINHEQQTISVDLADEQFKLLADVSHQNDTITVTQLALSAGKARLSAQGELALDTAMAFKASGELIQFDPSRFAKTPAAQINARFKTNGHLAPRPVIEGSFELQNSQLAGQPLSGKGQISVDWPAIPKANIELNAGPNHLTAQGAFGRPQDTLSIILAAPNLAPYGMDADLSGRIEIAGSVRQPKISAQLKSDKLLAPGNNRITGLNLNAKLGGEATSPLSIELSATSISRPDQSLLGKNLQIQAEGSNQAHRIRGNVELAAKDSIALALEGGLINGNSWQGQLREVRFSSNEAPRNFQLSEPAELKLAADSWRIGTARFNGLNKDWGATLQANADTRRLTASFKAEGKRLGRIDGEFTAANQGAWQIDQRAPWQGKLKNETPDLAWLAELLGDQWQTAGNFSSEILLAGKPASPLISGNLRGDQLALRLAEQGLNLNHGELAVDLDNNTLRVKKLRFESPLQAPPRALKLSAANDIARLTAQPGTLEISGEMAISQGSAPDKAYLDVKLDRLGISQLADQWVILSGDGRLSWQENTFGAKGKLAIDAAYWQLAPSSGPKLSDDVIIKRSSNQPATSSFRPKLDLDITTDLGKNFLFKGAGLSSHLTGDIRLRASGRDLPRATGSIRTRDGKFDAYGQQLDIERGILSFQGLIDNPALDVKAVRKGLSVEPGVQLSGTALKPVVKLISDPELPDTEKLAWLVLGHGPEQMSAGDATILLSAAGGLLGNNAGSVVQQLKQSFGIDELGVRQGNIGDNGSRQATSRVAGSSSDTLASTGNQIFSVGKRLSSNTLLSYEQTLGKAESIVKLTVSLTRQISVIGRAGSDNALDIFYTFTFGRPERNKPGSKPSNDKAILPLRQQNKD